MSEKFINDETFEFVELENSDAVKAKIGKTDINYFATIDMKGVTLALYRIGRLVVVTAYGQTTSAIDDTSSALPYTIDELPWYFLAANDGNYGYVRIPVLISGNKAGIDITIDVGGVVKLRNNSGSAVAAHSTVSVNGVYIAMYTSEPEDPEMELF